MSGTPWSWLPVPVLLAVGAGIGHAVLALPAPVGRVPQQVAEALPASGVENPVTAVLLNFRGYDTLLELAVLSLAIVGIWSLGEMPQRRVAAPGLVLAFLVQVLVPAMVLLGAYLLWAGAHDPGGAFQAGAVLAAALVLAYLAGAPAPGLLQGWPVRLLLVLGPAAFVAAGLVMVAGGGRFLELPPACAGQVILAIEAAAAVSIGSILASAFGGGRPRQPDPCR